MYEENKEAWHRFSMNVVVCRSQNLLAAGFGGLGIQNPLLSSAVSAIATINLTSLLDEALEDYIQANGLTGKHGVLFDRINLVDQAGRLKDAPALHKLRGRRNDLGHIPNEPGAWEQFDKDMTLVHDELQHLGILGPRANYQFFYKRNREDATESHVAFVMKHRFGVEMDGEEYLVMEQTVNVHRVGKAGEPAA